MHSCERPVVKQFERAVIVGVGLLGGSIGLALRARKLAKYVVGISPRGSSLASAIELGAIDSASTTFATACRGADLAIVCTPVQSIAEHVQQCFQTMPADSLITDVGSTKESIVAAIDRTEARRNFVGSHPLAGSEKSGVEHARENLFNNKLVVVTPAEQTVGANQELVSRQTQLTEAVEILWQSLGARTLNMSPRAHDAAVAQISHLPHLLASALAAATPSDLLPLAASGWCDTTRVAAGGVLLWRQILEDNRHPVIAALEGFSSQLDEWLTALRNNDGQKLEALLLEGKQKRDALGN